MDKVQEIKKYVEMMKLKKVLFGGYDKEDVSKHVGHIIDMVQQYSEDCKRNEEEIIAKYQIRLEAMEMTIQALSMKLEHAVAEKDEAINEKEHLKGVYQEYCSKLLEKYSDSLKTLSGEFSKVIDNITTLQRDMLEADVAGMFGIEEIVEVVVDGERDE